MKNFRSLVSFLLLASAWVVSACGQEGFFLSDIEAVPDGVSVLALGNGNFRVVSVASAPCSADTPAHLSAARTVATAKAKAALSRFLDEKVTVDEFLERERTRVRTEDGQESVAVREDIRRMLVRIKTQSNALLRGVTVFRTEYLPATGGGGALRLVAGVDSSSIQGAGKLEEAMQAPQPKGAF